ncbi:DUF2169 family type VI secretion system accessory protein [Sorangium sp. So ce1024]|uniref:DUF2169 family type VI secretion system accessory protein n=1 Tax=unclassified Sorangium TaxID=2621164 RepID=UPI003F010081
MDNRTDFIAAPFLLVGKAGERLVVVVKATFVRVAAQCELELSDRAVQRRIRCADVPWGDPERSSIKYPADLCIAKPGTDVVVVAAAHAPGGRAVPFFDAGVRLGALEKIVRIFGLRVWQAKGAGLSDPRPTTGIEVRYDYAWGGLDQSDPSSPVEEPRNPVGMGIARDPAALTHKPAPFIEDPTDLIGSLSTRPAPAGLGAIGRHWEPRRRYLGTYDAAWRRQRAPLLPLDHDDRTNLCASPGLIGTPALRGGEDVALLNLTPGGGTAVFRLPRTGVEVAMRARGRAPEVLSPDLDTVLIDALAPSGVVVELVWRASFQPPRRMKDVEIVVTEREAG